MLSIFLHPTNAQTNSINPLCHGYSSTQLADCSSNPDLVCAPARLQSSFSIPNFFQVITRACFY